MLEPLPTMEQLLQRHSGLKLVGRRRDGGWVYARVEFVLRGWAATADVRKRQLLVARPIREWHRTTASLNWHDRPAPGVEGSILLCMQELAAKLVRLGCY